MDGHVAEDFHVAIVGAGIGGLALAMALHKKSVPFTVYEEAKQYSVIGAGIGFGPNGLQAMDMIEEQFRPRYEEICVGNKGENAQHVFFEGLLMEEGFGLGEKWYGHSSWGHPDYTRRSAHRKDLLDIMTTFIPKERVKFSKRLTNIQQSSDRVTLTFADGEVVESSILVGTDGIQSIVRDHVLQLSFPHEIAAVYANSYCYRGVIPIAEATEILGDLTDVAKMYMGNGRCCVTYRISSGKEFNFLLCVYDPKPWPVKDSVTQEVSFEEMIADFEGPSIDKRFLQLLSKAKPIKWGLFHHRHTSKYYRGRAALLGDSAHASLPFQAAGASQALEDALILSGVLTRIPAAAKSDTDYELYIQAAFEGYDCVRRPRATKQLIQSAEVSGLIHFQDAEAGSDMSKILPRLQKGRFDWLWFHDLNKDLQAASKRMISVIEAHHKT